MRVSIVEKKTDIIIGIVICKCISFVDFNKKSLNQIIVGHSEIMRAFCFQLNLDFSDHKF